MRGFAISKIFIAVALITGAIFSYAWMFGKKPVDYNTQVKPIFNKKCISCHGGVKRKSGFSLLFRTEALAPNESGKPAIVPGDPGHSELIRRITTNDPEDRMPYKQHPLSEEEISTLRQWISEGAKWGDHWAYTPVKQQDVPPPPRRFFGLLPAPGHDWISNDIDAFILDKMTEKGLEPSAEAGKNTLLRRVSLDLIGMPAPEETAKQFLSDASPGAYERLVDTLLAQPGYGEKWTSMWLDLARYADTKGYERDDERSIWRYRDWLIRAFNRDMPYDSFLVYQLAGDLLPGATDDQILATAFHRNTMTNDEGGTDNEEFRTAAVIDRVNTTWQALLGTTFSCVQCHSHPYDPFRHEDYYRFMAFFNNTRDEDSYAEYPLLYEFRDRDLEKFRNLENWLHQNAGASSSAQFTHFLRTRQPSVNGLTADSFRNAELADTKWLVMRKTSAARLRNISLTGNTRMLFRYMAWPPDGNLEIHADSPAGRLLTRFTIPPAGKGWTLHEEQLAAADGVHDLYLSYRSGKLKKQEENGVMFDWFYFTTPFPGAGRPGYDSAKIRYYQLLSAGDATTTPVMEENPGFLRRKTYVFERGNWLSKTKQVLPGVPATLNPMPEHAPPNRLGLAMWMTDAKNPLTSRTIVNRIWEQVFGQGLVETLEDMGTQGMAPSHPELLDHLSWRLMHDYKWSLKKLLKEIVMSATYRQEARSTPELLRKDPNNRWYARSSRVRLSAEQIRDQALSVSGLLSGEMYGPPVMPWQPPGIWSSPYNGMHWEQSPGNAQYRRALYTFWKRTSPYPSFLNFDAVAREVCTARRIRTNTPLQALTLLNDSAYLDISRHFAYRVLAKEKDIDSAISAAYQLAAGTAPSVEKMKALRKLYDVAMGTYKHDAEKTCELIGVNNEHNNPSTAAMVVVMLSVLNLDDVITKP